MKNEEIFKFVENVILRNYPNASITRNTEKMFIEYEYLNDSNYNYVIYKVFIFLLNFLAFA